VPVISIVCRLVRLCLVRLFAPFSSPPLHGSFHHALGVTTHSHGLTVTRVPSHTLVSHINVQHSLPLFRVIHCFLSPSRCSLFVLTFGACIRPTVDVCCRPLSEALVFDQRNSSYTIFGSYDVHTRRRTKGKH